MVDGPYIVPASYFKNPVEEGLDRFMTSYGWMGDQQKKSLDYAKESDLLSRQLRQTQDLKEWADKRKAMGGQNDSTTQNMPGADTGGGSAGSGSGGGDGEQPTIGGVGGSNNPEIDTNNFAGMRNPNAPIGGGPRSNPAGWQQFATPEDGVRGIVHQIDRYVNGQTIPGKPLTTLNQIISTWAPPHENNTKLLIDRASQIMGVSPDQPLDWNNPDVKARLVEAMIRNEQGGMLHPKAVQGIQGVFGQNWQPYQTPQQQQAAPGNFAKAVPQMPPSSQFEIPPPQTGYGSTPMAIGGNTPATTASAPAPPASAPPAQAPSPPATGAPPASGPNVQYTAPGGSFSPPQQSPRAPNYSPNPNKTSYLPDQQQQSQIAALVMPQQYDPRTSGLYPQGNA